MRSRAAALATAACSCRTLNSAGVTAAAERGLAEAVSGPSRMDTTLLRSTWGAEGRRR
jgi:hypothetical protein